MTQNEAGLTMSLSLSNLACAVAQTQARILAGVALGVDGPMPAEDQLIVDQALSAISSLTKQLNTNMGL